MIRYRLRERMADYQFETGEKVTLTKIAESTGINRSTLSKLSTQRNYNTTTEVLDKLCAFFKCEIGDIAEHVPDVKKS